MTYSAPIACVMDQHATQGIREKPGVYGKAGFTTSTVTVVGPIAFDSTFAMRPKPSRRNDTPSSFRWECMMCHKCANNGPRAFGACRISHALFAVI